MSTTPSAQALVPPVVKRKRATPRAAASAGGSQGRPFGPGTRGSAHARRSGATTSAPSEVPAQKTLGALEKVAPVERAATPCTASVRVPPASAGSAAMASAPRTVETDGRAPARRRMSHAAARTSAAFPAKSDSANPGGRPRRRLAPSATGKTTATTRGQRRGGRTSSAARKRPIGGHQTASLVRGSTRR
jgi:hypothetical protein